MLGKQLFYQLSRSILCCKRPHARKKTKRTQQDLFFFNCRHGNKAGVWQDLIDQQKLPYLATLRNLRNLVLAGIDSMHVDKVCAYIKNEKAVCGSKLFPYRFFTAFAVLEELKNFKGWSFHISN